MKDVIISPVKIIFTALLLFFLIYFILTLFVFELRIIEGHSMEPAFYNGDLIFINKLAYGLLIPFKNEYITYWKYPEHGDIVLLKEPEEGKMIVKRCTGIPGDPVDYRDNNLYIASRKIPLDSHDPFTFDFNTDSIPQNHIFVMGDNPDFSIDSRHFGFVDISFVYGKVIFPDKLE